MRQEQDDSKYIDYKLNDKSSLLSKNGITPDDAGKSTEQNVANEWDTQGQKKSFAKDRIARDDEMETNEKKRVIFLNDDARNAKYPYESNYIKTTKYNIFTFLPVALFLQFLRVANIYFLIIAILQSIPAISPLNPVTAIMPLAFVLGVSLLREGIEDYNRYKSDK